MEKEENKNFKNENDIERIIEKCGEIEDKKQFIKYISNIIKEKDNFLYCLYKLYSKQLIIKILEKTLMTMKEGGLKKKDSDSIRTIGGTFIYYIKNNNDILKDDLKKIFWRKGKNRKERKKMYKKLKKLEIKN
jgi:hypothetical protein